jgi:DDE superfamily endonuclease
VDKIPRLDRAARRRLITLGRPSTETPGSSPHRRQLHLHASKKTQRFLAQFGGRVVLHFLPPYCPDDNRIERVWLDLHANVTRNHRCKTIEELMVQVVAFMRAYNQHKKLNPSLRPAAAVSGSRSGV